MEQNRHPGALSDITVIDLTRVLSGPFATMWMGEMGANIIKVEIPNGASGTRIAAFTIHHLLDTKGRYGLFSSCCGGGLGVSTLIERV